MKITRDLLKEMISEQIKRIRLNEADEMDKLAKMSPEEYGSDYEDSEEGMSDLEKQRAEQWESVKDLYPEEDQERMREIFIFGPEHMSASSKED